MLGCQLCVCVCVCVHGHLNGVRLSPVCVPHCVTEGRAWKSSRCCCKTTWNLVRKSSVHHRWHHVQPANLTGTKNSTPTPPKWVFLGAAVSPVHGGHYANLSGCLGPVAPQEFIIIIARRGWECCECEPETSGSFFHEIYIQGNPENVPNLNLEKTHRMV